jgi:Zn finger protein HypA/HybF involved in hydrogenase expression
MHEYGIVQNVLSQVDEQVKAHAGKRAVRVFLAVDGGHIDERFLRDAFDMFKASTTARDAVLVVTHREIEGWCPDCGARTTVMRESARCPYCGGAALQTASVDEIYLQSVEIEV